MSGIQLNSITAAGNAAANTVASALVPKKHINGLTANASAATLKANAATTPTTPSTTAATAKNISSTDFLTLLVSELKNQDPTQPTDPNAYITQLAQVNSLQQLININTGITTLDNALTPATTPKG